MKINSSVVTGIFLAVTLALGTGLAGCGTPSSGTSSSAASSIITISSPASSASTFLSSNSSSVMSSTSAPSSGQTEITTGVLEDKNFGSVIIGLSLDEFNNAGFSFGDSVDVIFDNGYKLEDIPYYDGYYARRGDAQIAGYPGYEHPYIARTSSGSMWEETGVTENSKVTVRLREKGKYRVTEESFGTQYTNDRKDYNSDEAFANFRTFAAGDMKQNFFYRSASPIDNSYNRAEYASQLAEQAGIRYVLNLSDNEEEYMKDIANDSFSTDWYQNLYKSGNVQLLNLSADYGSDSFQKTLSESIYAMTKSDGPVLIHCVEGKDRTGFACALIMALADASCDEILNDYMITYDNYYGISKQSASDKYDAIEQSKGYDILLYILHQSNPDATDTDLKNASFKESAEAYLKNGGLNDAQINEIESFIRQSLS
ncbi:MAG: tyrosine-protein phosphatase [Eubacterium sp.]|nr:tyrosine-protein phosphatase [Eubacterium sp.]